MSGTKFVSNILILSFKDMGLLGKKVYDLEINVFVKNEKKKERKFREPVTKKILQRSLDFDITSKKQCKDPSEFYFEFLLLGKKQTESFFGGNKLVDKLISGTCVRASMQGQIKLVFYGIVKKKKTVIAQCEIFHTWRKRDTEKIIKLSVGEYASKYFISTSTQTIGGIRNSGARMKQIIVDVSGRANVFCNYYRDIIDVVNISHNHHSDTSGMTYTASAIVFYKRRDVDQKTLEIFSPAIEPPKPSLESHPDGLIVNVDDEKKKIYEKGEEKEEKPQQITIEIPAKEDVVDDDDVEEKVKEEKKKKAPEKKKKKKIVEDKKTLPPTESTDEIPDQHDVVDL